MASALWEHCLLSQVGELVAACRNVERILCVVRIDVVMVVRKERVRLVLATVADQ